MLNDNIPNRAEQAKLRALAQNSTTFFGLVRAYVDNAITTKTDPDFDTTSKTVDEDKAEQLRQFMDSLPHRQEQPVHAVREAVHLAQCRLLNLMVSGHYGEEVSDPDPAKANRAKQRSRMPQDDIEKAQAQVFSGWKTRGDYAVKTFPLHEWQTEVRPIFMAMKELHASKPGLEAIKAKKKMIPKPEESPTGTQIRIRMDAETLQALRTAEGIPGPGTSRA